MNAIDKDLLIERFDLSEAGPIPHNQRLPVLVYRGVLGWSDSAHAFERLFQRNGWTRSWRNGLYDFHHFHSTAHEVLGIATGSVRARIGGDSGPVLDLNMGDVILLPAGTGHKSEGSSDDLLIVGAYDAGRDWDLRRGAEDELNEVRANIAALADPGRDPVTGQPLDS